MVIDPRHPDITAQGDLLGGGPIARRPRVFVVQETDLNLAKATRFGELVPVLPGRLNITMSPQPVIRQLRLALRDINDGDLILPVGDPVAIGLAFTVAASLNNGRFRALKWDKQLNDYYTVAVDVYDRGDTER